MREGACTLGVEWSDRKTMYREQTVHTQASVPAYHICLSSVASEDLDLAGRNLQSIWLEEKIDNRCEDANQHM